jgi:hypothetical protein
MKVLVIFFSLLLIALQSIDTAVLIDKTIFNEVSCCQEEGSDCCKEEDTCGDFCCSATMSLHFSSLHPPQRESNFSTTDFRILVFYIPSSENILLGYNNIPELPPKYC